MYTSLIVGYKNKKNVKKCWEIYDDCVRDMNDEDEILVGLMIKICAETFDCEKAKHMFENVLDYKFKSNCLPFNSLIKVLATRPDV